MVWPLVKVMTPPGNSAPEKSAASAGLAPNPTTDHATDGDWPNAPLRAMLQEELARADDASHICYRSELDMPKPAPAREDAAD